MFPSFRIVPAGIGASQGTFVSNDPAAMAHSRGMLVRPEILVLEPCDRSYLSSVSQPAEVEVEDCCMSEAVE
jgi:hypothetical protein